MEIIDCAKKCRYKRYPNCSWCNCSLWSGNCVPVLFLCGICHPRSQLTRMTSFRTYFWKFKNAFRVLVAPFSFCIVSLTRLRLDVLRSEHEGHASSLACSVSILPQRLLSSPALHDFLSGWVAVMSDSLCEGPRGRNSSGVCVSLTKNHPPQFFCCLNWTTLLSHISNTFIKNIPVEPNCTAHASSRKHCRCWRLGNATGQTLQMPAR